MSIFQTKRGRTLGSTDYSLNEDLKSANNQIRLCAEKIDKYENKLELLAIEIKNINYSQIVLQSFIREKGILMEEKLMVMKEKLLLIDGKNSLQNNLKSYNEERHALISGRVLCF